MKGKFTKIMAALALLVFMMPSLVAWGQTYEEVLTLDCATASQNGSQELYGTNSTTVMNASGVTTFLRVAAGEDDNIVVQDQTSVSGSVYWAKGQGGTGIPDDVLKLGKASGPGSISFTLINDYDQINKVSITGYGWKTSTAVSVNGSDSQSPSTAAQEVTFDFELSSATRTISIAVTSSAFCVTEIVLYKNTSAPTLEDNDLALTGAPIALEFDLYDNSDAQVIHYTTSSSGAITLSASNFINAVVDETQKTITVTPVAVTPSIQTITVSQAADATYAAGSTSFTVYIEDNTPFDGVIFDATKDKDENNTSQGAGSITKDNVTFSCTSGILGNGTEYRMYKNSTTTISITGGNKISKIEFIGVSGYEASNFTNQTGWTTSGNNGIWEGEAESVSFVASSAQVRATLIKVTVLEITTPFISANDVNIAFDATSGEIAYTLNNPASNGNLSVSENVDWISDAVLSTTQSKVTFNTTANEATTAREGIITITYTYGDNETVSKDVTITQAAAPVIYTTIPELFAAATTTTTPVIVTFGDWVVTGVKNSQAFVTDGMNGFIVYQSDHGFDVGNTLSGTANCNLILFNSSVEITDLTSTTEGLIVGENGTVTPVVTTINTLQAVNTGSVVTLNDLTYNGTVLSDGTNEITPYNTLFAATSTLENGKTYNVTGVFVLNNTTKRILPRSAEDIVEVQVQHDEYTLTVGNPDHISFTVNYDEEVLENGETAEVQDGTEITFTVNVENGYVLENVTVVGANQELVSFTETSGVYTFNMPAFDVTINATAVALTGDQYELYTGAIVEGDYLIVYDGGAMNTTVEGDRLQYEAVTATNNVIVTDNAEIVWHIAPNGEYWTIYNADADAYAASTGAKNKAQMLADGTDDKALWTVSGTETYEFVNKQNTTNEVNANLRKNGTYGFACYATSTGGALSLYKKVEATPDTETCTLTINGYTDAESKAGYYLIASPVTVNIADVDGLAEGDFDLYSYDESQELEWINYKQEDGSHPFTTLEPGKGYLYAKKATAETSTYTFTLTGTPYCGTPIVLSKQSTGTLAGWNLIGNPLATSNIAPGRAFYIMNSTIGELIASESNTVEPKQGFFVIAEEDDEVFELTVPLGGDGNLDKLVMNLSQNRGTVIDRAIVRFGEGEQLPKFQLFESSTKLYIPQGNSDYAIVRSAAEGEMPVNTENVEMDYLHLIDNMTGNDVDLLQTPSYTFEATTRDYASRFRLVFNTNGNNAEGNANFAYFNGSEWQISNIGEATLQVVDVMGRIVKNVALEGNATVSINEMPGVYMMRLLNGLR